MPVLDALGRPPDYVTVAADGRGPRLSMPEGAIVMRLRQPRGEGRPAAGADWEIFEMVQLPGWPNGFYDGLLAFFKQAEEAGFLRLKGGIHVVSEPTAERLWKSLCL